MIRTALRPHQVEALARWRRSSGAGFGLFMEQRTGKTLTALAIADELNLPRVLIVCPPKAVPEWERQIAEHWSTTAEVKIHTMGELADPKRNRKLKRWIAGNLVIADETHRVKSISGLNSRRLRSVSRSAQYRLALTGTPTGQGPQDLWAQFDFLDPTIFGKWSEFRALYCIMGGYRGKKVVGQKNQAQMEQIVAQHSYRVSMREVNPQLIRVQNRVIKTPLTGELAAYRSMAEELVAEVKGKKVSTELIVTQVLKLQQITGGSILDSDGTPLEVGDSKLRLLLGIKERPLVIVYRFLHEFERIRQAAPGTVQSIRGGENTFDPEHPADWILLQVQSGESLDLSAAKSMVFYSWDYSHFRHSQVRARILVYNSTKVTYYYLVMVNTIDEILLEVVRRKKRLSDLLLQAIERGARI